MGSLLYQVDLSIEPTGLVQMNWQIAIFTVIMVGVLAKVITA